MTNRYAPTHPGALTPAQLTRRAIERAATVAAMVAITAAAVAILSALIIIF